MSFALTNNVRYVALAHNHPDGNPTPSAKDVVSTISLYEQLLTVNIYLLEHFVVTKDTYVGIKKENQNIFGR